jgi:hypothetical protein
MNRAALMEQLKTMQETINNLLSQLESSEADKFLAHLYQARKRHRLVCERPNNGNKTVEREVISSYQVAQSLGFNGDFRQYEHPKASDQLISRLEATMPAGLFFS